MINKVITFAIALGFLAACSQEGSHEDQAVFLFKNSVDISYGTDMCSFTHKVIETVRYGGKITMKNGDVQKFMSVECVAGFYLGLDDPSEIGKIEIVDFAHGQQYLPVSELVFLRSSLRPSPNGMFLTAVDRSNDKMKQYIYDAYPGSYLSWDEVLRLVRDQWEL